MVESPITDNEMNASIEREVTKIEDIIDVEIRKGKLNLKRAFCIDIPINVLSTSLAVQYRIIEDYKGAGWDIVKFTRDSSPKNEESLWLVLEKY
jgi:hypothetical protein